MSVLARPAVLASILVAAALTLHPALAASRWLPGHPAVLAALLLLAALALAARAAAGGEGRAAPAVAAAGAVLLVAALAVDGVRGRHGTLTLAAGQTRASFDEEGPDGRPLGLRPLGFPIGAESVDAPGGGEAQVALALPGRDGPSALTSRRAVAFGGYRFARPRATTAGGVSRLRVAISDGATTQVADVGPGAPEKRVGDLTVALAQYFPDFALDEQRRPFSRSAEPRNPAALLDVEKGGRTYRAFVLQSMPGIHRVEELGLTFSLLGVEPEQEVEVAVHREPAALAVLVGALLLAAGLAISLPRAPAGDDRQAPARVAGFVLVGLLLLADRGAILAWSFGVHAAGGRRPLSGVGVLLGGALVAALGGSLLLAAGRLSGTGEGVERAGRGALWLALGAGGAGLLLAAARVAALPAEALLLPLGGIAAGLALLGAALLADRVPLVSRAGARALPLAALGAVLLAAGAGVSGVLRDGTYATPFTAACAAAALLGLAALEETRAPGPRRFAFLLSLLALAVV